jgi:hypothetical protein
MIYVHIPKTGGTALKNAVKNKQRMPFRVCASHMQTVFNAPDKIIFGLRDPIERFCSGFWARKNHFLRQDLALKSHNRKYTIGSYNKPFTEAEQNIFNQCSTPNDMVSLIKQQPDLIKQLDTGCLKDHIPLGLLTILPLTTWIGNLDLYKQHENRIHAVFNVNNLTSIMQKQYGVTMPEDNFQARRHTQFDIEQSYDIDINNTKYLKSFFKQDYELMEYIKQQDYYIAG